MLNLLLVLFFSVNGGDTKGWESIAEIKLAMSPSK